MSCPVLSEHQAEAAAAAAAAQAPAGTDVEEEDGQHAESWAAGWRTAGGVCRRTSVTREQWHHGAQYPNFWWNPTPNTPDPDSNHASGSTAGHGACSWSPAAATAARWDACAERHAPPARPSPSVPADGSRRRWGWGDDELSPTSATNASSDAAAAAKRSSDQHATAPTTPQQFAPICQQTPRFFPNPPVPGKTSPRLCNASPAAAAWCCCHGRNCWGPANSQSAAGPAPHSPTATAAPVGPPAGSCRNCHEDSTGSRRSEEDGPAETGCCRHDASSPSPSTGPRSTDGHGTLRASRDGWTPGYTATVPSCSGCCASPHGSTPRCSTSDDGRRWGVHAATPSAG